jgi:2-amino-4-hydroxy-6-hydroxymethyldihydropteridine diphosphokinase
MTGIYLLLGSNLENRAANLQRAKEFLTSHSIIIKKESQIYETAPWGIEEQPAFLNQVIEVDTSKSPERLLTICQDIEKQMGRIRHEKWGERLIDIDILYFGEHPYEAEHLVIPHPGIPERRFTLLPLVEIAPQLIHPVLKQTQKELLANCPDHLEVKAWQPEWLE